MTPTYLFIYFYLCIQKYVSLMERSGSVGRVLDLGLIGRYFETHRRHCVVSLRKTLYPLLSTRSRSNAKSIA